MTTEDDFQNALDANPEDHATRLVFADWLQERDDPRAEGYRALARLGAWTFLVSFGGGPHLSTWYAPHMNKGHRTLPADWFQVLDGGECLNDSGHEANAAGSWCDYRSRRRADDAAARAFAKLPPERRTELLAAPLRRE